MASAIGSSDKILVHLDGSNLLKVSSPNRTTTVRFYSEANTRNIPWTQSQQVFHIIESTVQSEAELLAHLDSAEETVQRSTGPFKVLIAAPFPGAPWYYLGENHAEYRIQDCIFACAPVSQEEIKSSFRDRIRRFLGGAVENTSSNDKEVALVATSCDYRSNAQLTPDMQSYARDVVDLLSTSASSLPFMAQCADVIMHRLCATYRNRSSELADQHRAQP